MAIPEQSDLPGWVAWLAQDANGIWWGFEAEPHRYHCGWYENEVGRYIRIRVEAPNPDWQTTLEAVA